MLEFLRRRIQSGAAMGAIQLLATIYARIVHRLRIEGIPPGREWLTGSKNGGLIVVANHVSGLDPVLVQVAFPKEIRWMMDRTMMVPAFGWFWRFLRIIEVDTECARTSVVSIRDSLRHLKSGGVLGIFPEGQIARPPDHLQAFLPGAGVLASRSGARTVIFVIDGVPQSKRVFASLLRPSRARIRMLGIVDPPARGAESEWTRTIRARMAQALGVSLK